MNAIIHRVAAALACTLVAAAPVNAGQSGAGYPGRPLTAVVGYPPGGVNDILARVVAEPLGKELKQSVVVENRAGANGIIGVDYAAKAAPDGYTLLFSGTPLAVNESLHPKLPYKTLGDFQGVSLIASGTFVLVVNPSLPVKSVAELIDLARKEPGKLNFCSSGSGAPSHLMGELLKQTAGIDMTHVPYRGVAPCLNDLLGNQVQLAFEALAPLLPHIQAGKLRALAVMSETRSDVLPDLPTIAEASGYKNLSAATWYGLFVPAGTPDAIVSTLNKATIQALNVPEIKQKLSALGLNVSTSTPAQLNDLLESEVKKWAEVVKASGAKVD